MPQPRVSVIIIFLNAERFLGDAITSVMNQTFADWELLLVDDGSTDGGGALARQAAERSGGKVRYLTHPGGGNRGMSASRNLGIASAAGEFISFLDADDVWVPEKLAEQVAILDAHPELGFVGGRARYWFSWTGDPADQGRDTLQTYALPLVFGKVLAPSDALMAYLNDETASTCDTLLRRSVVEAIGGYESSFRDMYEDQVFRAKLSLAAPGIVMDKCWYWYRQHPDACTSQSYKADRTYAARRVFLEWLEGYLTAHPRLGHRRLRQRVWKLLFPYRYPRLIQLRHRIEYRAKAISRAFR